MVIGTSIQNVCCPFGISSKESFFNLKYDGIVANYVSQTVGILDLNGSEGLLSVEGSPIIKDNCVVGIRLPNLHNRLYATSFSFFTPISSVTM